MPHLDAQRAQRLVDHRGLVRTKENQITGFGTGTLEYFRDDIIRQEFQDR